MLELIGIFFLVSSPSPGNLSASSVVDMYNFANTIDPIITVIPVMTIAMSIGLFSWSIFSRHFFFLELL